jgi:hypothetical protein
MGLFDKISTDGTGTTQTFTAEAAAFAKMDLNSIFKMSVQGVTDLVTNAIKFFHDIFGKSDCNDQDAVLVERMWDQIPGMALLLSDLGYLDSSNGDYIREAPGNIYNWMATTGRPHGPDPCNALLPVARTILTILFGVRIVNSDILDALDVGPDAYYQAGGNWVTDIPRNAVDRAVKLKQQFFPQSTYNVRQWDMNKFQDFPLVAPIPDPLKVGLLYTGQFLNVQVVNGLAIGNPIPDVQTYTNTLEANRIPLKPGTILDINKLPSIHPTTTTEGNTPAGATNTSGDLFNQGVTWVQAHPLETVGIIAVAAIVIKQLIDD